jgi:hypothetical protein
MLAFCIGLMRPVLWRYDLLLLLKFEAVLDNLTLVKLRCLHNR